MLFFAYHKRSRPTGKALAKQLGFITHGVEIPKQPDFLVRWGTAMQHQYDRQGRVINSAHAINNASDKVRALRLMQDAGVRVPEFHQGPLLREHRDEHSVWLGRNLRGFGGKDIVVYPGVDEIAKLHEWYSKYVPNDREYRIHVCGGRIVRVVRKYLERPEQRRSEYVKNHANGYVFMTPQKRLNASREEAAVKAVEALGLDFGAVDIIVGRDNLEYVLEVNTAPACSPKTLAAYTTALAELIKTRSGEDYQMHPQINAMEAFVRDTE